jgi:hypothetical protein
MDNFEESRRGFLRKLGLTVGATMVASTAEITATVLDDKDKFQLSHEQQDFMVKYEQWMDEFIPVIRKQKQSPHDVENNKKIVTLSDTAKAWQKKLTAYMQDDNFARHYMVVTDRMTKEI